MISHDMTSRLRNMFVGLARDSRASEIAEAALVFPIMFMVFMGIFWFGQAFSAHGTLTHAARMGARAAVAPACTLCTATTPAANAAAAVTNALQAAHLNPNNLVANPSSAPNSLVSCTSGQAVTCDSGGSNPTNICVQENVLLSTTASGGTGVCGVAVSMRYKYPYHFYLPCYPQPCTPLDLGTMALSGEAEMRSEAQ